MAGRFDKIAFAFNGTKVYDALFIKEKVPTYFVGCSATILKVIEKKNIPVDKFYFASYSVKTGYKECSADYKSRRLLIKAEWVEVNVPGFGIASAAPSATPAPKPSKPSKVYPPAPPLLDLDDSEKFLGANGKVIEIEVRGERHWKNIWFKARDVEKMLEMANISGTLICSTSAYEYGRDFVTFNLIPHSGNPAEGDQNPQNKNETAIFLSYSGLVRMLITRRHPIAERFQDWAFEKLFTLQHGTQEAKQGLAADVLGVSTQTLKAVLNTNATSLPVIYLFQLGTVQELRNSFPDQIPETFKDSDIVYKYGLTTNFKERTIQHEGSFKKFFYANGEPVRLQLKYHVYIDPAHLDEAEMDIEKYFKSAKWHLKFKQEKLTEVAAVPENFVSNILHNEFKRLGQTYAGRLEELQTKLQNEQKINEQLKVQIESQEQSHKESMRMQEQLYREAIQMREETHKAILDAHMAAQQKLLEEKEIRLKEKDEMMNMYKAMMQKA